MAAFLSATNHEGANLITQPSEQSERHLTSAKISLHKVALLTVNVAGAGVVPGGATGAGVSSADGATGAGVSSADGAIGAVVSSDDDGAIGAGVSSTAKN